MTSLGSENIYISKWKINGLVQRYFSLINSSISKDKINEILWSPEFSPNDPDIGWGKGNYKTVNKLTGKNVEIVPINAKGFLLDSTCSGGDSTHAYFYLLLKKVHATAADSIVASVYCYASDSFDTQATAALRAEGTFESNSNCWYKLNYKGSWQKLSLNLKSRGDSISLFLYLNKRGVQNFSTLKGHVIFAHPTIIVKNKSQLNGKKRNQQSLFEKFETEIISIDKKTKTKNLSTFKCNFLYLNFWKTKLLLQINKNDPIRDLISKIISEDTTYFPYTSNLNDEYSINRFGEDRLLRWKFAIEIFSKEYNWIQKIFGGGFNFISWFGKVFEKDKTDHPHSPFLYILLYSGIIGVLLYSLLLYMAFKYYIKYFKYYPLLLIFFLITYYFTFFSGGNPFDPPMMGFFMMLPFLIHSVHKNDEKNNLKKENEYIDYRD